MPVRVLSSHPHVVNNRGRVAVTRGPLVYCVEATDHPGVDPWDLVLPAYSEWRTEQRPGLLGGGVTLNTDALTHSHDGWDERLYRPSHLLQRLATVRAPLMATPYYAWANRASGPMQVWLPVEPS